ncbi:succinyldiaminopimelate transaminase [Phycicoccus sp. Soil748]|uniref:succinyldiaminopimelate transaminase n=1 Tax=Phycicoccus sp. Soil748 TaxID=1736397 RepID=UPI0007031BF0|nr:succinyldiaminopimelate transaminase [Phycicoccus sp. Soil748]KRE54940.1 succinyldiaminopimelate transaminase [Phycicoccus sp. Soil748]
MTVRSLPDFPWDSLAPYKERASSVSGGIVDLSVGTPVDPTPAVVQEALRSAADAPGYPLTYGTAPLREAVAAWFARRRGVPDLDPDGVMPTIGSKELVAWLPTLLGLGQGDVVGFPGVAYPTYDVGARLAGATPKVVDGLAALGPLTPSTTPKLLWLNSPSNPTGRVLGIEHLAKVVAWARQHGVVVASDECYAELDWRKDSTEPTTPSILDPRVTGGSHQGLLAVYSLSKQSNLAGYRAAFVAGDVALVRQLLEVRKHAGMIVPWPVQQALTAALGDDAHVAEQKARYAARRTRLRTAVESFGLRVDHSDAGLYLWATRGEDAWATIDALSRRGILAAPGTFYGQAGREHVRIALTATDERIATAVERLRS